MAVQHACILHMHVARRAAMHKFFTYTIPCHCIIIIIIGSVHAFALHK